MFGIGETELVIIVVFAFLLFGPDKLPGMGRTLGRVLRQFREASDGFTEVVQTNIMDPASEELEKSPKQRKREEAQNLPEDADAPQADEAPRRETFAERRARLMAERRAAEAAAAEATASEGTDGDEAKAPESQGPSDLSPVENKPAPTADDASKQDEPVRTTAADLYAITTKSSRTRAQEEAEQKVVDDIANGEEDGSSEA